jgi:hypothetical protein
MYDQQAAPSVARQQLDELTRRSAPANGGMHHLPTVPEDASLPASSFTPQPSSGAAAPRPLVHEFNQARQQKGELRVNARITCTSCSHARIHHKSICQQHVHAAGAYVHTHTRTAANDDVLLTVGECTQHTTTSGRRRVRAHTHTHTHTRTAVPTHTIIATTAA